MPKGKGSKGVSGHYGPQKPLGSVSLARKKGGKRGK